MASALKVFVTGGTGFIGARLIEVLLDQYNADVKALAHRTSPGALRLASMGVPLVFANLHDTENLAAEMEGCDAVFHLAFGKTGTAQEVRRTTVDGTLSMIRAAQKARVRHFINVGTAAVYFRNQMGVVDETSPRSPWGWSYADEKLAAENLVLHAAMAEGFPGSVFQVAGVYGPWGETFVINPLEQMRRGIVVLPNGGNGISNLTYVDDVVQGLLLGLSDAATGEVFILKGDGQIPRIEAFKKLEAMLGYEAVVGMPTAEIKRRMEHKDWRELLKVLPVALNALKSSDEFREVVRSSPGEGVARNIASFLKRTRPGRLVTEPISSPAGNAVPYIFPPKIMIDYLGAELSFSADKAKRRLGFVPKVSLEEGMGLTEQWARWANLIGPRR